MTEERAQEIADEYNRLMYRFYIKGHKTSTTDIKTILTDEYQQEWEDVYPYLRYASDVWIEWENSPDNPEGEIKHPWIGVFAKYGLLHILWKRRRFYSGVMLSKRIRLIHQNRDLALDIMKDSEWKFNFTPIDIEIYKNEGKYGDDYPCDAIKKDVIYSLSNKIMKELYISEDNLTS